MVRRILRRPTEESRRAAEQLRFQEEWAALTPEQQLGQITDPELRETFKRMLFKLEGASPPKGQNQAL
jgi:hypothetical protein